MGRYLRNQKPNEEEEGGELLPHYAGFPLTSCIYILSVALRGMGAERADHLPSCSRLTFVTLTGSLPSGLFVLRRESGPPVSFLLFYL